MKKTFNDKLIVEAYKTNGSLRPDIRGGIARPEQKTAVVGLKLLVQADLKDGVSLLPGTTVFFKEEDLHTQAWAKKLYNTEGIEGQFMIVNLAQTEFVDYEKESVKDDSGN